MNPAFSVIFLTTLIGCGQGLFIATVVGSPYQAGAGQQFPLVASAVTLALLLAGLAASFFHLGRPERAWRAAASWRTSWLSREVIVLPVTMILVAAYGCLHWFGASSQDGVIKAVGWIGVAVSALLFICTSMIYACIKFLQEWASALTVAGFTTLGLASGLILASSIGRVLGESVASGFITAAMVSTAIAMIIKLAAFARNARIRQRSTIQTAIGIKHRNITQRSMGHTGGSFNTHAFFHHCSSRLIRRLRSVVLVLVFVVPLLLLAVSLEVNSSLPLWTALLIQFVGLIAERWLFFAQANHPQNLYYQTIG